MADADFLQNIGQEDPLINFEEKKIQDYQENLIQQFLLIRRDLMRKTASLDHDPELFKICTFFDNHIKILNQQYKDQQETTEIGILEQRIFDHKLDITKEKDKVIRAQKEKIAKYKLARGISSSSKSSATRSVDIWDFNDQSGLLAAIPFVGVALAGLSYMINLRAQIIDKEHGQFKTRIAIPILKLTLLITTISLSLAAGGLGGIFLFSVISATIGLTGKIGILKQANDNLEHSKKKLSELEINKEQIINSINEFEETNNLKKIHYQIENLHNLKILTEQIKLEKEKVRTYQLHLSALGGGVSTELYTTIAAFMIFLSTAAAFTIFPPLVGIIGAGLAFVAVGVPFLSKHVGQWKNPKKHELIRGSADILLMIPKNIIKVLFSLTYSITNKNHNLLKAAGNKHNNIFLRGLYSLLGTGITIIDIPIKITDITISVFTNLVAKLIASKEHGGLIANLFTNNREDSGRYKIWSRECDKLAGSIKNIFSSKKNPPPTKQTKYIEMTELKILPSRIAKTDEYKKAQQKIDLNKDQHQEIVAEAKSKKQQEFAKKTTAAHEQMYRLATKKKNDSIVNNLEIKSGIQETHLEQKTSNFSYDSFFKANQSKPITRQERSSRYATVKTNKSSKKPDETTKPQTEEKKAEDANFKLEIDSMRRKSKGKRSGPSPG